MKNKRKTRNGNNGGRYFIEELVVRDVRYNRIFKLQDRELEGALKALERYFNGKYQEDFRFFFGDEKRSKV